MSGTKKNEGMSAEDLKRKMYSSLQSAGVLNDLRGHLRQSVINELRGRYQRREELPDDSGADLFIGSIKQNDNPSWEQKAVDNLVYQHLKQSRYLYALSVFQQESGVNGYEQSLTEDLLRRLGASPDLLDQKNKNKENEDSFRAPHSSTPVANSNDKKLLMWKILSRISSPLHMMTKRDEMSVKDEKEKGRQLSLAEKLQAIDEEMDGTLRQRRYDDIEQRRSLVSLTNMTRKAEEEAEKRARETFEQWKKVELSTMRVEEQERAREKILETTRKLEDDFSQRREALINREKNAIERLNNQKDSMEKDLHHQRQTLLQELEHIQLREKSLQERERILRDMEMVKLRELDLIKAEALSEQLRSTGVKGDGKIRHDSIVSSCAESLRRSLTGKESRQLDEVLKEMNTRAKESQTLRSELDELKKEIETSKTRRHTEPTPSSRHQSPRDLDDRSLRQRLDTVTRQLDEWSHQNRAEKESTVHEEMDRWRQEMTKLLEVKNEFERKQQQLDDIIERVSSRVGSSVRTPRKSARPTSGQPLSTSLRLLMDPQYDVTKRASIRDYEPVHAERNVRWADKMPYSINSNVLGAGTKSPRNMYGAASHTTLNLDSSNDTTSSVDLSTSGIRRDIREKFRSLEKETEQLDQMYRKYINVNYKDDEEKAKPSQPVSYDIRKQKYDVTKPKTNSICDLAPKSLPHPVFSNPVHRSISSRDSAGNNSDLEHLDVKELEHDTLEPKSINREALSRQQIVPPLKLQSPTTSYDVKSVNREASSWQQEAVPSLNLQSSSTHRKSPIVMETSQGTFSKSEKLDNSQLRVASPSGHSTASESDHSSASEPVAVPTLPTTAYKSLPLSKDRTLSPLSPRQRTLPPLKTHESKLTVSELLIGSETGGFDPENVENSSDDSDRRYTGAGDSPPKSPFDRPALLEKRKEELLSSKSMEHEAKSANRNTGLEENEGFEEILQNIDLRRSRSIDDATDPKLTDLLNKLEPVTSPGESTVTSPMRSINRDIVTSPKKADGNIVTSLGKADRDIVTSPKKFNQPEQVIGLEGGNESMSRSSFSKKNEVAKGHKVASKDDEYSDEFTSSASEVKTMSDFEQSSTSIPRIEEKVVGLESEEDKSDANINWSSFHPDKSGDLLSKEPIAKEFGEVKVVDFDKSVSDQSLEAPSDGGKKEASDDDFW